jgi:hypothetical protein
VCYILYMAEPKEYLTKYGVRLLTVFVLFSLVFTFLTAYTKYMFAKDYEFYIEAPCDPTSETCFVRDCDDYCPPNGLDTYRAYMIPASTFPNCTDNSCSNICLEDATADQCTEILCDAEVGDSCSDVEQ